MVRIMVKVRVTVRMSYEYLVWLFIRTHMTNICLNNQLMSSLSQRATRLTDNNFITQKRQLLKIFISV